MQFFIKKKSWSQLIQCILHYSTLMRLTDDMASIVRKNSHSTCFYIKRNLSNNFHFHILNWSTWKLENLKTWSLLEQTGVRAKSFEFESSAQILTTRAEVFERAPIASHYFSFLFIASSWCILSAISHVGVGDKISVRFRFAVLHIISVSTHSNLNHHFKNYQLFSYVDLNRLCPAVCPRRKNDLFNLFFGF